MPEVAPTTPAAWTLEDAADLYGIDQWGAGYFVIGPEGTVQVRPDQDPSRSLDLKQLVDDLRERGIQAPFLIRFSDILRHRLAQIASAFGQAIQEHNYQNRYRCVYPIKVNQQRHVVEEILTMGREHGFGIEAGSKPELLAVMALVEDSDTPIICNGFKDAKFVEAVILATKIGRNIIPVVEKFSELKLIIQYAKAHDVRPKIGIRVKLSARGAGRWEQSGGARSKFGLFISEVVEAAHLLEKEGMLDCLQLLHFHLGSQINEIRSIKAAITELARVYVELRAMGAGLNMIDVGGGLGVDYGGTHSSSDSSINYSLQEYANNVVYHIQQVCDEAEVPHPTILSESGRAITAHHAVLVFGVMGWSGPERFEQPQRMPESQLEELPTPLHTLHQAYHTMDAKNFVEYYHDAQLALDETMSLFNLGYCTLEQRGLAERLYYAISSRTLRLLREMDAIPEEFAHLESLLSNLYFCNFSIFQSLPDSWAIDQIFPTMPLHRLREKPSCRGILADITCDSDGQVDRFICSAGEQQVLDLHPYQGGDYLLASFLVGAYQETLGDLHNLFGDTHAVHVSVDEDGRPFIDEVVEGDTVSEVLSYVQYEPEQLRRQFRRTVEQAVKQGRLTLEESKQLRCFYEDGLAGYTYLT